MKMCPDIYTWVGTLHIATSGESAYYSVSGGTPHMKSCSNVHTGVGTQRKIQRQRIGGLAGLLALSDYSANTGSILQVETCEFSS